MGRSLILEAADWAAIVTGEAVELLGAAADVSVIPEQQRRRLPTFAREVMRCTLPLLRDAPSQPVILAAAHGDLQSTVKLLTDLAHREILSPALFAMSVHNAAAGAMSLALTSPGDQTALAGNSATLQAALVEAYARLASGEAQSAVVCYAEPKLPDIYSTQDEAGPGVFLALRLELSPANADEDRPNVAPGRVGALALVRALARGERTLRFQAPGFEAMAA